MKSCSKWGKLKSLKSFGKRKDSKDGVRGVCKVCFNIRVKKRRHGELDKELEEFRELQSKRRKIDSSNGLCTDCGSIHIVTCNGRAKCQKCINTYRKITYTTNAKEGKAMYYQENKDKILKNRAIRYSNNPEYQQHYQAAYGPKWDTKNKAKRLAITRKYQTNKLNATPPWLTKDMFLAIEEFYIESVRLTEKTGIMHHVDHIMPLQGVNAWGLQVPWNLQVLTASENMSKGNRVYKEEMYKQVKN